MHRILVIPGDGVGPEVVDAAVKVLEAASRRYGIGMEVKMAEAGDEASRRHGTPLPVETARLAVDWADAILKGPVGETAGEVVVPLRRLLGAYANVRPARTIVDRPCRPRMDVVIVRENLEGIYSGIEFRAAGASMAVKVVTREGTARVARVAARIARARRGRATIVHKANVLRLVDGDFRSEARRVLEGHGVEVDEMYVDAAAMELVRNPSRLDVMLTMNQYGDILSDLAAEVAGGIGLAPSANIGEGKGLFEPVHGAAWDIAGKGIANPTATILSAAMMLDTLGHREASRSIERAVEEAYRRGHATPDMGGSSTTMEFAEAVASLLG